MLLAGVGSLMPVAADLGFLRCGSGLACSADDTINAVGLRGVLEKILLIAEVVRSFEEGIISHNGRHVIGRQNRTFEYSIRRFPREIWLQ